VLRFNLNRADFSTATRVRDAINGRFGDIASVEDGVTVALRLPAGLNARSSLMAEIEMVAIDPAEAVARVVVNSRTGTVVISSAVRLAPAAISHGSLVVRVEEDPLIVQPEAFSRGQTAVEPSSTISLDQPGAHIAMFDPGASLASVVDALNALGATPADLVAILEALKQAGSLQAEMVVI
jgi:flagellar P-ring protein precursor FlgI